MHKVGVWFVGALGNVATCAAVGAMAFARGLIDGTGLVSEHPDFEHLRLAPLGSFIFGGHDVRRISLPEALIETQESTGIIPGGLLARLEKPLLSFAAEIRPGFAGERTREARDFRSVVSKLRRDIERFRRRNRLDSLIVVNVASAEPCPEDFPGLVLAAQSAEGIRRFLAGGGGVSSRGVIRAATVEGAVAQTVSLRVASRGVIRAATVRERSGRHKKGTGAHAETRKNLSGRPPVPPSLLYALAAMESGCAYVNFTSSTGASLPGMDEIAQARGVPHAGRDGKTGETLVKTVLAPMFVARRLKLLSWEGHNLLGNSDGAALRDEANKRAKTLHKDAALRSIVRDDSMHSAVRIDYVPSLADWKTAWDFIHFEGFLGARMVMQFIWQGCDSALAAPLVLDLVRFAELALRRGESGAMRHLACFFKDPVGCDVHDFSAQLALLRAYALRKS